MLQSLSTNLARTELWIGLLALASCVVLFWVLRGAPPGRAVDGETDELAPGSGYRDRVIAAVVLGLMLILWGGYLAIERGVLWSVPAFATGFGLVLTLVAFNRQYRHHSPSLRRTVDLSGHALNAALLAGILIVSNVIAYRYGGRPIDLTRERIYSLSPLTLNQVESLGRPVTFHKIYGAGRRAGLQRDRVSQLLELYRAANPRMIKVVDLNPYTELARAEDLAKRVPDLPVMRGGGVLVEYGEGSDSEFIVVPNQQMFETSSHDRPRDGYDRFETAFHGEDAVTSALLRLREARKPKIGFTTGHGEPSTSDVNPAGGGVGQWRARLSSTGSETLDLNLLKDSIPEDLALLIVAGPRTPFKNEELARLKVYTDRGGPVLALLGNVEPSGLEGFLRSFNLELGQGLIVDPMRNYNRSPQLVFTFLRGDTGNPIADTLQSERAILIPNGAPVHILGSPGPGRPPTNPVNPRLVPSPILITGPQSWAETDLANPRPTFDVKADVAGPLTVGVVVIERPAQGSDPTSEARPRLVLFSSKSIGDNVVLGIEPTNLDLLMNAASWLRGRKDAVGIAPNTHVALTLTADPLLRSRLIIVPTVMAMMLIVAAGVIVYVARRE